MARDEREEEREFLERLQARTGRDLAEWMAAITLEKFTDKNLTIDWLRAQGLSFQRASWLERIHVNGGKPIYGGAPPKPQAAEPPQPTPAAAAPKAGTPVSVPPPPAAAPPRVAPSPSPAQAVTTPPLSAASADLEKLIAGAKGYRPLYQMLETAMRGAVPNLNLTPRTGYIAIGAPAEFAAVTLHATEVRLGLDLGERPFDTLLQKSKMKGPGPTISHMAVLTDARQVNSELMKLVETANSRVNKRL